MFQLKIAVLALLCPFVQVVEVETTAFESGEDPSATPGWRAAAHAAIEMHGSRLE